ncbi:hypothetical protein NC652_028861 [Populus alba x Populus x berolinensis]|nr:hypothetical protein NC652_028861 [Populus alba x Populus x berolinensis]
MNQGMEFEGSCPQDAVGLVVLKEKNQEIGPGKGPRATYQTTAATPLQHRWGLKHKNAETEPMMQTLIFTESRSINLPKLLLIHELGWSEA